MTLIIPGNVWVVTKNGGHGISYYVDNIVRRMISISHNAHPLLKAQALSYKDSMRKIVDNEIRSTVQSDRLMVADMLEKEGMSQAAEIVRKMKVE